MDRLDLNDLRSKTIWRSFAAIVDRYGDKQAFVAASDDGTVQRFTYRRLFERACDLAAGLSRIASGVATISRCG